MPALESAAAPATVPTFMLTQTRVIRAPRERVYAAWTTPALMQKWFGGAGRHCPGAEVDLRVGGAGSECASQKTAAFGHYTKIVPNELLQFTWGSEWQPGEKSLVTVSLKDVAGGTEIGILHENFNTEASREGHNQGWMASLDKLANLLES